MSVHVYHNTTLDAKYLGILSADFIKVADKLKEASYLIRKIGNYPYPVFVVSQAPVSLGALLIEKDELGNQWNYYATYLEVLVQCKLIIEDKVDAFKNTYKDPDKFCCLLVVDTSFTSFLYTPYPID